MQVARWQVDTVCASKLLLLLPVAAVCAPRASDPNAATSELLPYLYLLLRHTEVRHSSLGHSAMVGC